MTHVAKMAKFDEKTRFLWKKNGRVCAEMCAEKAEKCDWNAADGAGISESNGRCFASETIGASK